MQKLYRCKNNKMMEKLGSPNIRKILSICRILEKAKLPKVFFFEISNGYSVLHIIGKILTTI